ncbi:MAG: glycosyltransferase family 2 protein [Lachnospiraceae bacterium]|nr:glycosyltransferase family 2 protein [Lachnospiraceae bacterium]
MKVSPYMIRKGLLYLKHFGVKRFWYKLMERMEPEEVPYGPWYEQYRPTGQELERQRETRWSAPLVFSILVPAWHSEPETFRAMIRSVKAQTYPYWELCIANATPEDEGMRRVLEEEVREAEDGRIRVIELPENLGIAGNTNAALEAARGDFVALLDHDDLLSPAALYQLARHLEKHPGTDMVYTDEDKISADGQEHSCPHLKPDFNEDLLRSNNYICHFLAVKRTLALEAGGFRADYDGAQDYDFIFRCSEKAGRVGHVPEILYHWRTSPASTADNPLSKQYAYEAGRRAIEDHLKRLGVPGQVTSRKDPGFYQVSYPVQKEELISIIIPNKDEAETLRRCLDSIHRLSTYRKVEILVVENHSTQPETFDYYRQIDGKDGIRVLYWEDDGRGFNYPALNNFGVKEAKGEVLLFLNNDTEVITPDWLEQMLGICQRPEVGAVGARLYYPDNTVQHAGVVIGIGGEGGVAGSMCVGMKREYEGYMHRAALLQDMSAVTAACLMMRRSVYEQVGGLDEQLAVAFNDIDLCLKVRQAGYLVVYDPYAELYHHESKTRGAEDNKEKIRRFQSEIELMRSRWTQILREGDPYYNKNLSRSKWNYSLRDKEHMA